MKNKHEIEKIAFELYQRDGCMQGRELDHWVEAERIFHSRHTAADAVVPAASKKASAGTGKKKVAIKASKTAAESKPAKELPAKAKPGKSSSSQKEASL